jgi:hypothetical protein
MSDLYNDPDDFDLDEDDFEEEDELEEGSGAYELHNPKHPKFKANYDKFMKKNPDSSLKDFINAQKAKEYKGGVEEAYTGSYGRPKKQKKDELGDLLRLRAQERKDAGEAPEKHDARYLAQAKPKTRRSGQEHDDMQRESIQSMIETILSGNLVESTQSFSDIIASKIAYRLEESKVNVAQRVFGIQESHDDDDDNDHDDYSKTISKMKKPKEDDDYKDEKHAEVDDTAFSNNNTVGQIKRIVSSHENKLKEDEKENPNDKRVQAGLAARAAKGETTDHDSLITFQHSNGQQTKMPHSLANFLQTKLVGLGVDHKGTQLNPTKHVKDSNTEYQYNNKHGNRERLEKLIHSSPHGLKQAFDEMKHDAQNPKTSHHKFEVSLYGKETGK